MQKKFIGSETSTHNQREEEIKRGYKEEMEGFPVSIFLPPNFRNMRMLVS